MGKGGAPLYIRVLRVHPISCHFSAVLWLTWAFALSQHNQKMMKRRTHQSDSTFDIIASEVTPVKMANLGYHLPIRCLQC